MFSTKLKENSFWPILEEQLRGCKAWNLKECERLNCDLAIPLRQGTLRVYLFTADGQKSLDVEESDNHPWQNVQWPNHSLIMLIRVAFSTDQPLQRENTLAILQARQIEMLRTTPIIPCPSPENIIPTLSTFVKSLESLPELGSANVDMVKQRLVVQTASTLAQKLLNVAEAKKILVRYENLRNLMLAVVGDDEHAEFGDVVNIETIHAMKQFWKNR